MKKTLLLFCFIVLSNIVNAQDKKIVGTWKGLDSEKVGGTLIFDKDGYLTVITLGDTLGGKEYKLYDQLISFKYETDQTAQPHKIQCILTSIESNTVLYKMSGVYRYLTPDKLELRLSFDFKTNYNEFVKGKDDDTIILTRE